jgi:hypothetical protein
MDTSQTTHLANDPLIIQATYRLAKTTRMTITISDLFPAKTAESFIYDADGNQTSDERWANRWGGENRLTEMGRGVRGGTKSLVWRTQWMQRCTATVCSTVRCVPAMIHSNLNPG